MVLCHLHRLQTRPTHRGTKKYIRKSDKRHAPNREERKKSFVRSRFILKRTTAKTDFLFSFFFFHSNSGFIEFESKIGEMWATTEDKKTETNNAKMSNYNTKSFGISQGKRIVKTITIRETRRQQRPLWFRWSRPYRILFSFFHHHIARTSFVSPDQTKSSICLLFVFFTSVYHSNCRKMKVNSCAHLCSHTHASQRAP